MASMTKLDFSLSRSLMAPISWADSCADSGSLKMILFKGLDGLFWINDRLMTRLLEGGFRPAIAWGSCLSHGKIHD